MKTSVADSALSIKNLCVPLVLATCLPAFVLWLWTVGTFESLHAVFIWRRGFERVTPLGFAPLAVACFACAVVTAFFVQRMGARRTLIYFTVSLIALCAASFVVSRFAGHDIGFVPLALSIVTTFIGVHLWRVWSVDANLSSDIERAVKRSSAYTGTVRREASLDTGLHLLQMMLGCDEAVVYGFDARGLLLPAARLRLAGNEHTDTNARPERDAKVTNQAWREGVRLCETAIRKAEFQVLHTKQIVSSTSSAASLQATPDMPDDEQIAASSKPTHAARVAVPLSTDERIVGALLVSLPRGFNPDDRLLLEATGSQLARDLQRDAYTRDHARRSLLPAFLSTHASHKRVTGFNLIGGKLLEASFPAHALDASDGGYAIASLDGQLAFVNQAMRNFADIDRATLAKFDLFQLLDRFRSHAFDEPVIAVRRVMQTGTEYTRELYFTERDQTLSLRIQLVTDTATHQHHATASTAASSNTSRAPLCLIVTVRDISQIKEHERLRSDMVSLMSHELRTPITSINGFAELLAGDENLPADAREFLTIISNESQRLSRMIDNFLLVTRLEQGDKRHGSKSPLLLDDVVRETITQMQPTARRKRIRLVERSVTRLPPVIADRSLIMQAVQNLVDNAIRYSPERTTVAIGAELDAEVVRISVEDRGYGIPPEDLDRVWEKFFRVVREGEDKDEESTGLGLSFVREVVEHHGGTVGVASQIGRGSRFHFTLPRM
ncbi:MAG: HAMP domain-containing histidine kinase [Pyrinomonadaceae bacterium MAG19_C2-C3]|nr:HAMP domain-containing histidine kinase [Pyrinomonadaceae bacterium MAG19_C2-C3]